MMTDNNHDEKNAQKPKTPQTPFGGWASTPPKSSDDSQNGAPRAVVSNEDGSQRPAQAEDLAAPKSGAAQSTPVKEPLKIKSFSATFGAVKEADTALPTIYDDDDEEAGATENTDAASPLPETPVPDEEESEDARELPPQEPTREPDPFAWTPEEASAAAEPRRSLDGGESWMQANTSYEELQSSTRAALQAAEHGPSEDLVVEETTPTVNPYTFNKGDEWTAPPMDADTLAAMDAPTESPPITDEEKPTFEFTAPDSPAEEEPEDESQTLSPFNFASYAEADEEQAASAEAIPETEASATPDSSQGTPDSMTSTDVPSSPATTAAEPSPPETAQELQTAPEEHEPGTGNTPARTNFQAYKSAETAPSPIPEEFALQPEEAHLLGESDTASPQADAADMHVAQPEPPTFADIPEPLPEELPVTKDNSVPHQEAPLPEAYTPPSVEESPLPEQSPATWETPDAQVNPTEAEPDDATAFGGGAGEYPQAALAAAQADILREPSTQNDPAQDMAANSSVVNNSHSVEEIQAILQGHALWLNSGGKDGRRANFRNASLQHCDLSNSRLAEASFRGANLIGVNLSGSDMRGADMSEAQLSNANFSAASLAGAIFSRTDLRNAVFDRADLQAADFSGAFLTGAVLAGLNLSGAVLLDADLQSANLAQVSLIGANLRGANMTYANLTAANLSNANCRDVRFDQAVLDGAVFEGANLKNASVQGASLLGTDLSSAGETTPEQRQETIQAEKEQLLQEWQRLKEHEAQVQHLQASIQQREMALHTERVNAERGRREIHAQYENLEKLIDKTHEVMHRHRIHDRQFKYFGVLWFIFTILIAVAVIIFVSALELNELDWLELSIVFGGCALIMGLFIATTVRSIKLSNNLKQLLDMYGQQLPPSDKTGH